MNFLEKRANTALLPPLPKVLSPSGSFEGDDGKWSTFLINIAGDGDGAGQNFRVLISTSSPITMVPAQASWCNVDCAKGRGILTFNNQLQPLGLDTTVTRWKQAGIYSLPTPNWWSDDLQFFSSNGTGEVYGLTTVGLGEASKTSITFDNQYVASTVSRNSYLGSMGLAVGEFSPASASLPTFFSSFAGSTEYMASTSYGYTAGASYRNNNRGIPGNMVFGGYDRSRYVDQGVSISMPNARNNSLTVGVQSILYAPDQNTQTTTQSFTPNGVGFSATIDSSIPYLVLPNDICNRFVQAFGLGYDSSKRLYTVNATSHERNLQQNATISFRIGASTQNNAKFTTIVLPYPAFDLQASFPIYDSATNYFPIRNSTNGMYVLGRTFLQEAYLIVDYERTNFTVAPARFADPMPKEDLVTIFNKTYVQPKSEEKPSGGALSAGAIAGIVVGIAALFLILGILAFFYWKKRQNAQARALQEEGRPSEIDTMVAGGEIKHRRVSELTGSEAPTSPGSVGATYYGADNKKYPAIAEMSPESHPAELYSPPSGTENEDYFAFGPKPRRRGATRSSTGNNSPGTPIAELAGDFGQPQERPQHSRSPSDTSLTTNIDEVLAGRESETRQVQRKGSSRFMEHTDDDDGPSRSAQVVSPVDYSLSTTAVGQDSTTGPDNRPSHTRGLSDTTINSDSTAVSQPTPEELARWATNQDASRRPLSQ